jgi:hypothetical protein
MTPKHKRRIFFGYVVAIHCVIGNVLPIRCPSNMSIKRHSSLLTKGRGVPNGIEEIQVCINTGQGPVQMGDNYQNTK